MSEIVIAPLSHNPVRDWPAAHYRALIGLLLDQAADDNSVMLVGTRNQRLVLNEIARPFAATRVANACGLDWNMVVARIRTAACVIGNNSGVTHLAGLFGVPAICIFGGSHQRTEWGPLSPSTTVLSRVIGCSPCQLHEISHCPYDIACLREITPEQVAAEVMTALDPAARGMRSSTGEAA
jgi:ADP-heptose:LPS heptosyltransferase